MTTEETAGGLLWKNLTKKRLGRASKNRLKERGVTQIDLGKITGVDTNTIGNYVNGNSVPSADKLFAICNALECREDWLLRGEVGTPEPNARGHTTDEESSIGLATAMSLLGIVYHGGNLDRIIALEYMLKTFVEIDRLKEEKSSSDSALRKMLVRLDELESALEECKKNGPNGGQLKEA